MREARGGARASDAQPAHALTAPPRLSRMEKAAERALEARQRFVCSGLVLGLIVGLIFGYVVQKFRKKKHEKIGLVVCQSDPDSSNPGQVEEGNSETQKTKI